MGLEHYFIVIYQEAAIFSKNNRVANQRIRTELDNYFHFCQITEEDYQARAIRVFGRMKHYHKDELLRIIADLPWMWPETVQVLVKSEHDDQYAMLEIERPNAKTNES